MATPNYGYEKRQRELAKKKKKEEKLRAKSERKTGEGEPQGAEDEQHGVGHKDIDKVQVFLQLLLHDVAVGLGCRLTCDSERVRVARLNAIS